jgi:hypothetical protein
VAWRQTLRQKLAACGERELEQTLSVLLADRDLDSSLRIETARELLRVLPARLPHTLPAMLAGLAKDPVFIISGHFWQDAGGVVSRTAGSEDWIARLEPNTARFIASHGARALGSLADSRKEFDALLTKLPLLADDRKRLQESAERMCLLASAGEPALHTDLLGQELKGSHSAALRTALLKYPAKLTPQLVRGLMASGSSPEDTDAMANCVQWWAVHGDKELKTAFAAAAGTDAGIASGLIRAWQGDLKDLSNQPWFKSGDKTQVKEAMALPGIDISQAFAWGSGQLGDEAAGELLLETQPAGDAAKFLLERANRDASSVGEPLIARCLEQIAGNWGLEGLRKYAGSLPADQTRGIMDLTRASEDPVLALRDIQNTPSEFRERARRTAYEALAQKGPRDVQNWLATLPDGEEREQALQFYATTFESAALDPAIRAWLSSMPGKAPPGAAAAIKTVAESLALTDPAEANEWLGSIKNPELQAEAAVAFGQRWMRVDPPAFSQWINEFPASPLRDRLVLTLVRDLASDPERAFKWAATISDPDTRNEAVRAAHDIWRRTDPAAAEAALHSSVTP